MARPCFAPSQVSQGDGKTLPNPRNCFLICLYRRYSFIYVWQPLQAEPYCCFICCYFVVRFDSADFHPNPRDSQ